MRNLDEEIGQVTHDEAEQLALSMIDKCFNNQEKPGRRWQASIPVSAQDTDVRLMAYIRQQRALLPAESAAPPAAETLERWATSVIEHWTMRGLGGFSRYGYPVYWMERALPWSFYLEHGGANIRSFDAATPGAAKILAARALSASDPSLPKEPGTHGR